MTVADSTQALAGHQGHLNQTQQAAFDELKKQVEEEIGNDEEGLEDGQKWYNDTTLLRFLRARSFNVPKAKKQFMDTHQWRKDFKTYDVYKSFPGQQLYESKEYYPRWTGRRDKMGRPVYVYKIGSINKEQQDKIFSKTEEERYRNIVTLTEMAMQFDFKMLSSIPSESAPTPIDTVTSIVDLEGFSIGQMWTLRNHLQVSMRLASAHYPETLGAIAVVNAPSFFGLIWNYVIKRALDTGTQGKIFVLGNQPGSQLKELISPEDLPKVYGGELDWVYQNEPIFDDQIKKAIGMDQLPKGPIIWKDDKVIELSPQSSAESTP